MDPSEKKRLANEKRLKAIREWKKNRSQQPIKINPKSTRKIFDEPSLKSNDENKLTLFDSDGEEDNCEVNFSIRPQFEGERGQYLFERHSELPSRFKLDERFKEDNEEIPEITITEEQEEKVKNMKILESVLGYEVIEKYPIVQKSMKRKKMVRFDPEDEDASEFLHTSKISDRPPPPPKEKKAAVVEEETEEIQIPVSKERYIEIGSNLKGLLKSSTTSFSLSEKFSSEIEDENKFEFSFSLSTKDSQPKEVIQKDDITATKTFKQTKNIFENGKNFLFFISENDDMLKEGVEFFQRKKTLEEIYEDWKTKAFHLKQLFQKKKRGCKRNHRTRKTK